jgi:hypothetical protein
MCGRSPLFDQLVGQHSGSSAIAVPWWQLGNDERTHMIAVCTPPDDDARVIAQDGETRYSIGNATKYWANLDLIISQPGGEARFSLRFWDIQVFIGLVEDSLKSPSRFIGFVSNDLVYSYNALRVEIKQGSQHAEMPQWIARSLAKVLQGYAV